MKKLLPIAAVVSMAFAAQSVSAGEYPIRKGSVDASLMLSIYDFDNDRSWNGGDRKTSTKGFTFGLGYNLTERFALEGMLTVLDDDDLLTSIDALYHIDAESDDLVPYVAVGYGHLTLDGDVDYSYGPNGRDENFVNAGGGLKFFATDNLAFRTDLRAFRNIGEEVDYTDLRATFGFTYSFGGEKKVVDSDGDGVNDPLDQCPNTPKGYTVGSDGCEVDSDSDGVKDSADQCPNTLSGASVDSKGCALDTDKDGVIDHLDQCADTPQGAKIDEKGCQIILQETVSINLEINFASGSSVLENEHHSEINKVADFMSQYPSTSVVIEGHSDSLGKASFNKDLSQRRADSVKQYLIDESGIDASRVQAMGYGEERPIADNKTKEGREKNRRVIAVIKATVNKPQ